MQGLIITKTFYLIMNEISHQKSNEYTTENKKEAFLISRIFYVLQLHN